MEATKKEIIFYSGEETQPGRETGGIYFSLLQENSTKAVITITRRYILLGFDGFNNARSSYFYLHGSQRESPFPII